MGCDCFSCLLSALRTAKLAGCKEGMNLAAGRARELRTVTMLPIEALELWTVTELLAAPASCGR